jgi:hypothetical protein
MTSQALITASAAIILALGLLHLLYTFRGQKLHPREPALETQMKLVSPVITRQTTMWNAWVGFNASHSCGAIFFGSVYGYLALTNSEFLFESRFLCVLGLLFLGGYVVLGKLYWFSVPFRGIVIATVCYTAGLVVAWA